MIHRIACLLAVLTLAFTGCNTTGTNSADPADPSASDSAGYYAEETHEGRIYVLGTKKAHDAFKAGEIGDVWETAILAGPGGETVLFEVAKDSNELQDRLKAAFSKKYNLKL